MKWRWIGTWSPPERLFRLVRWTWERGIVGDGVGYGAKLTLGLRPTAFQLRREVDGWIATILGVRLHYRRSYGGRFP